LSARRKTEGFNLAFLDIMACGLGAVILLFLIVKHNFDRGSVEADVTLGEMEALEQRKEQLQKEVADIRRRNSAEQKLGGELRQKLLAVQQAAAALGEKTARRKKENEKLKSDVEEIQRRRAADVVADPAAGEESYLIGLKMEGRRIAVLLDHSASMTDEKLLDIIARKIRGDAHKQGGPKWRRAKKTARWMLNRLPDKSMVSLIAFNRGAKILGGAAWHDGKNAAHLTALFRAVDELVPSGATNLQAGLERLQKLRPPATDIYLITDGLPTAGEGDGCRSGFTVGGRCRGKIFEKTTRKFTPAGAKINVVLLPLEGDPQAAPYYWRWASASRGLMIAPAGNWP